MKPILPEKMRICLVGQKISVLSRSTDTGLLWPLARGLTERGHDVTIISTSTPLKRPEIFRDGIRAFYLNEGQPQYKTVKFADAAHRKFLSLHKEKPFHLVHSLDDSGAKIGRHKSKLDVSVAYDVEATHMAELFSILSQNQNNFQNMIKNALKLGYTFLRNYFMHDRSLLLSADGVFVTTPQQRMILERYFLYPDFHTFTVPYGINLGDLAPKPESENFKAKLNIPDDASIILAISDFTSTHEVQPLLKAFEKVVLKKSNTYLLLLGSGPQWKSVEYEMLKLALGSRVIMPGYVTAEEMLDCILSSPIYVDLSSRSTGLEPSLIEAMAQKKVVIGSELSPISEIIQDGQDGFLVRPADVQSLSNLLDRLINDHEFNTEQIGEKARHKVIDVFNRQKMIDSLINAYSHILLNSGRFKRRATSKSFFQSPQHQYNKSDFDNLGVLMTKADLINYVSEKSSITRVKAEAVVNTIFDTMIEALMKDNRIEIRGFGSFVNRKYDSYKGRNPRTGEVIAVDEKKLPFFKVGKELKEEINNGPAKT